MRILYINHYAGSINKGMAFRPYYLAKEWQKMGHDVLIVCANFSHLRHTNFEGTRDFDIIDDGGVNYQIINTKTYMGNGLSRAKTMITFCWKLHKKANKIAKCFKPDVVISSSTYPLDTYPAQKIAKISNCKYIHEGHDIWPLTLTTIGGMSKWNPFVIIMGIAENSAYKNADVVVSLLPNAYKHMLLHGLSNTTKFVHIPNGIYLDDWKKSEVMPDEHKKIFEALYEQNKFVVGYSGGHALSNALDVLIDVAYKFKYDNHFVFVLVGDGNEKSNLMHKCKELGLNNVVFLPSVRKRQVPNVLKEMDVCYVGTKNDSIDLDKFGVSLNKVYDYMMASKPIIYSVASSNNEISMAECGIVTAPEDVQGIADAIIKLDRMTKKELALMGEKGRKWVLENCTYDKLAKDFLDIMN